MIQNHVGVDPCLVRDGFLSPLFNYSDLIITNGHPISPLKSVVCVKMGLDKVFWRDFEPKRLKGGHLGQVGTLLADGRSRSEFTPSGTGVSGKATHGPAEAMPQQAREKVRAALQPVLRGIRRGAFVEGLSCQEGSSCYLARSLDCGMRS